MRDPAPGLRIHARIGQKVGSAERQLVLLAPISAGFPTAPAARLGKKVVLPPIATSSTPGTSLDAKPANYGVRSEDGHWWWDGYSWQPVTWSP